MNDLPRSVETGSVGFVDLEPTQESFLDAVVAGLSKSPKEIASKFFYDERGSELFARITELDEYYPTRTEMKLLRMIGGDLQRLVPKSAQLIEFGAGSNAKVRLLLDDVGKFHSYVPIDISRDFLIAAASELAADYPGLEVSAICADYTKPLSLPPDLLYPSDQRVGFFPGSTIGNLEAETARRFLRQAAEILGNGAGFIVGADLRKDSEVLNAAYNDSEGLTAEFNLNLLVRINAELGADFDLTAFRHVAYFNAEKSRIEMHLEALSDQRVSIGEAEFEIRKGERIHTENSYKYSIAEFQGLAQSAGLTPTAAWQDSNQLFSVHFFRV